VAAVKVRPVDLDYVDRRYHRKAWFVFRRWMQVRNPYCQRIEENGEQCHSPATECHHIVSPRFDPDRFLDATNVLMLCRRHHPKTQGEDFTKNYKYVPTVTD
jgi:hypothetical protein